jgi:glutaconate CoA-transferase subunit A
MYERDEDQLREWVKAAETPDTTQAYLNKYIYGVKDHQEYLELVGWERLNNLRQGESHE